MQSQDPDLSPKTQDEQEQPLMWQLSNCLNAILVLLTLPLYFLVLLAALVFKVWGLLAPDRLPAGIQFMATQTFFVVTIGLLVWFLVVNMVLAARMHNTMDFIGIEAAFYMFQDGLSGYLLLAGLIVAGVALKLTIW